MNITIRDSFSFFVLIQVIVFILTAYGMGLEVNREHRALTDMLQLETYVSIIEGLAYIWIWYNIHDLKGMATKRYFDWFITTLLLIFSSVVYFKYEENKDENFRNEVTAKTIWKSEKENILTMFAYCTLMLIFGFLGEIEIIPKSVSVPIGFVFFGLLFMKIYTYAKTSVIGNKLFPVYLVLWGLYGVSALLPDLYKNIGYNALDLVSKSLLGLYIFYLAFKLRKR